MLGVQGAPEVAEFEPSDSERAAGERFAAAMDAKARADYEAALERLDESQMFAREVDDATIRGPIEQRIALERGRILLEMSAGPEQLTAIRDVLTQLLDAELDEHRERVIVELVARLEQRLESPSVPPPRLDLEAWSVTLASGRVQPVKREPLVVAGAVTLAASTIGLALVLAGVGINAVAQDNFESGQALRDAARRDFEVATRLAIAGSAVGGILVVSGGTMLGIGLRRARRR